MKNSCLINQRINGRINKIFFIKNPLIIACYYALFFTGCGQYSSPRELILNSFFEKKDVKNTHSIRKYDRLNFCKIDIVKWDSIIILKPYMSNRNIDLVNSEKLIGILNNQSVDELHCTLLFVKKNECVAFGKLRRSIVDLSTLSNAKKNEYAIIDNFNCDNIYVESANCETCYESVKFNYVTSGMRN